MTISFSEDRTPPARFRVPGAKPSPYYACGHWLHRVQTAYARRFRTRDISWDRGLRVLLYHRVSTDPDELGVTPQAFRAQMELLLRSGGNPVTLDAALGRLAEGAAARDVCVTFDDGYHDNLDYAIPVLRDLGIPATIFAVSAVTDRTARLYWYDRPPPTLTWDELRAIGQEDLFEIGAHSRTHPALDRLPDGAAWEEIAGSRRDMQRHLGRPVTSFAYPAGLYGEREIRMVSEAGYRVGLTCDPGLNRQRDRPHALRRTYVVRRDSLRLFEARLTGLLDHPWGLGSAQGLTTLAQRLHQRLASPRHVWSNH